MTGLLDFLISILLQMLCPAKQDWTYLPYPLVARMLTAESCHFSLEISLS